MAAVDEVVSRNWSRVKTRVDTTITARRAGEQEEQGQLPGVEFHGRAQPGRHEADAQGDVQDLGEEQVGAEDPVQRTEEHGVERRSEGGGDGWHPRRTGTGWRARRRRRSSSPARA